MAMFGSEEELLNLLNTYRDKEYVKNNFVYWLHFYPNIISIMFRDKYRDLFAETVKLYMPDVLKKMIEQDKLDYIFSLAVYYEKELFESVDIVLEEAPDFRYYLCSLAHYESFEKWASEKQEKILQKALDFKEFNFPADYTSNLLFFLTALPFFETKFAEEHKDEIEKFLTFHFNAINPQVYDNDLLFLFETIRASSIKHDFINTYFTSNIEFVALVFANKRLETLKREKILDYYVELIKDAMRIENAKVKDMELKAGANSRTLIINDKVLKSGHKQTKAIPYHKRILQPIVRENIKYPSSIFNLDLDFVEVYERVDDLDPADYDKTFEVFKEMLKDGVVVADPSPENFGVLLKPNKPYHEPTGYKDEEFYIDDETVGIFNSGCKREILDKGDIVVRDVDCLYYFGTANELIESNVKCGIKADLRCFKGTSLGPCTFGPQFESYLDRYCKEIEAELENKNSSGLKK